MKSIFAGIAIVLFLPPLVFAEGMRLRLKSSSPERIVLSVELPEPQLRSLRRGGLDWEILDVAGAGRSTEIGRPQLPLVHRLIAVPRGVEVSATLRRIKRTRLDDLSIAPWQRPRNRNGEEAAPFTMDEALYRSGALWPPRDIEIGPPMIIAGLRVVSLKYYPVRVRPARRLAEYTQSAEITLRFRDSDLSEATSRSPWVRAPSRAFARLLPYLVLNLSGEKSPGDPLPAQGAYLILCHDDFCDAAAPLAKWKAAKGLPVRTIPMSQVGNNAEDVRELLESLYHGEEGPLDYVLLVGDAEHVPTPYGIWDTPADHDYTTVDGDDYLPDFAIGRMSGKTAEEIATQVQKTLRYEQSFDFERADWVVSSLNISGSDFYDDDNVRYCAQLSEDYGYTQVDTFLESLGTNTLSNVTGALNEGRGWISYFGHGDDTSWSSVSPPFTNENVSALTNFGMPTVITSIACANGAFDLPHDSFAEVWLKQEDGAGAALVFAAARNTPFFYTDTLGKEVNRAYFDLGIDTYGAAAAYAKIAMYDEYPEAPGGQTEEVMQHFHIFGDPELNVWSAFPLVIDPPATIVLTRHEPAQFSIPIIAEGMPVAGARVHLYNEEIDVLSFSGDDGVASFEFDAGTDLTHANIVVTARNVLPLIDTLAVEYVDDPVEADDDTDDNADDEAPGDDDDAGGDLTGGDSSTNSEQADRRADTDQKDAGGFCGL